MTSLFVWPFQCFQCIKVYSYSDTPDKKIYINGKPSDQYNFYMTTDTSVTFKVVMNSGYTLKKIEYESCDEPNVEKTGSSERASTNETRKIFKNGGTVKISSNPYYYLNHESYVVIGGGEIGRHYMSTSMQAYTSVIITYIDKYTKLEDSREISWFSKLVP